MSQGLSNFESKNQPTKIEFVLVKSVGRLSSSP